MYINITIHTLHYSARILFALNTSKRSTVTFCFDLLILFMQAIDMYTGNVPRQFTTKLEHSKLSIL